VPTHKKILFVETSPDVIHAFWVPEFLFKRDVIPGRENRFEVTVDKEGTFRGRCSELCGTYHSRMLFTLKSVSWTAYQQFLATATAQAKAGTNDMFTTSSGSGT
jgi:cytochrome c oxidase subunit 2